jgi:hypothetical protein
LLFVQGTALLMMIELVKSVISHARVIVSDFFVYFSLNGSFRLSACVFFIFQCMYMYLWSVNEIDAWAALTSQIRVVYHTFKQTIIYSICIENLKYRQVDIQTNKKKHNIKSSSEAAHEWKLLLPWGWTIMLREIAFLLPDYNIWSMMMTRNSDIRCASLILIYMSGMLWVLFHNDNQNKNGKFVACLVVSVSSWK